MEHNKIKQMLNQIETPPELKEELLAIRKTGNRTQKRWTGHRWVKVASVVAIVIMTGVGSVYAADRIWGISDLMRNLPKEAGQYINEEVAVVSTMDTAKEVIDEKEEDLISFSIRESLTDSVSCHVIVEVTLLDSEHYLLALSQEELELPGLAKEYYADAGEEESIMEYAKRCNKQVIVATSQAGIGKDGENYLSSIGGTKLIDETHALLQLEIGLADKDSISIMEEGQTIPINHIAIIYETPNQLPNEAEALQWHACKDETVMVVANKVAPDEETAVYGFANGEPVRVGNSTVLIRKITVTNTSLETKVCFDLINEDKEAGNWLSVNLIDEEGNFYENGVSNFGGASVPDENGAFYDTITYVKMELPEYVTVRVKDLNSGEVFLLENVPRIKE